MTYVHMIQMALLCNESFYYREMDSQTSSGECAQCTICAHGYYVQAECSGVSDTICAPCTRCGTTQYEILSCSSKNDAKCAECKDLPCEAVLENPGSGGAGLLISTVFRTGCGSGSKGTCRKCSSCAGNEYLVRSCSSQQDVDCAQCRYVTKSISVLFHCSVRASC